MAHFDNDHLPLVKVGTIVRANTEPRPRPGSGGTDSGSSGHHVTLEDSHGDASLRVASVAKKRTTVDRTLRAIRGPEAEQDHVQSCLLSAPQTKAAVVRRRGGGNWFVTGT